MSTVNEIVTNSPPSLIDTDVHNSLPNREALLPYLPKVWHKQWLETGENVAGYYSQIGQRRKDAYTPSGGAPGSDPEFLLEHLVEKHKIDYAILTHSTLTLGACVHYDPDYGNAIVAAHNDYMIDKWLSASPKFKGSILVNPTDPIAAAKEIERLGSHPDMVQVIMSSASRILYGQRIYHPIYEAAERHNLPVALHPGMEGTGICGYSTPSGPPTRYFEYHNLLPINFMSQVNSFVCEGVFEKFPNLIVVAIEGGIAWLPHLMWRMDKNYKALRDTVPWLKMLPSEYIKKHIRLTTQPIEEPDNPAYLQQIFEMCGGEDIVMFSSDYPHWDFDNPEAVLKYFAKDSRRKIFASNASKLYGLKEKVSS